MSLEFDATLDGKYPAHHPWTAEQSLAYVEHMKFVLCDQIERAWDSGLSAEVADRLAVEHPAYASTIYGFLQDLKNSWDGVNPPPEVLAETERRTKEWLDARWREEDERRKK